MANTFIDLNDTPSDYAGHGSKFVRVNADANALVFGFVELNDLDDVQANLAYTPSGGQALIYSSAAGKWRPGTMDVYSAGNGLNKNALTLNVVAGTGSGLTSNSSGVFITDIDNVAGTWGNASYVPVLTVNSKGQVTGVTPTLITATQAETITSPFVGNINGTPGQIRVVGGTGNNSNATIDLVATGVTAATYGNTTHLPRITVDTYGRIQNVDLIEIAGGGGPGGGYSLGFANIIIAGQTTVSADQASDDVTFVAGHGVTLTTQANADRIIFGIDSGAVASSINLSDLADVDSSGILNGQVLIWNSATGSFRPGNMTGGGGGGSATVVSGETPPVAPADATLWYDQVSGRLYIYYSNVWVDAAPALGLSANITNPTNGQVIKYNGSEWVNAAESGGVGDLSNYTGNIIPSANNTYTLGNVTRQWKELWVSNSTIYLGGVPISISASNTLVVGDAGDSVNIASEDYVINQIANISVPTALSNLTNDAGYITSSSLTWGNVTSKPSFSTVATSGSYSDLSNKPTIPTNTTELVNGNGFITNTSLTWSNVSGKPSFANVATSGSYDDLSNKPSIPTNTTQLVNGNGFITVSALSGYATENYVGNAVNALINGANVNLDTLRELADSLGNNTSVANTLASLASNVSALQSNLTSLSNVATSGSYNDLTDKPNIPADYSNANVAAYLSENGYSNTSNYGDANVAAYLSANGFSNVDSDAQTLSLVGSNLSISNGNSVDLSGLSGGSGSNYGDSNVYALLANFGSNNISTTGNVTGNYFLGNGSLLTGFANVAFTSNYNDLSNTPTIPTNTNQLVNGNGFITSDSLTWSNISSKPSFANVATSGSYNDLSDKPTIPSISGLATETYVNNAVSSLVDSSPSALDTLRELANALGNDANFSTTVTNTLALKANTASLANVAFTGSYTDLSNVPTNLNQFTNGPGYITTATANVISVNGKTGAVTVTEYSNSAVANYLSSGTLSSNITTTGNISAGNITGTIASPGSTTQIIFNDAGVLNGNTNFTFDKANSQVNVTGHIVVTGTSVTGISALDVGVLSTELPNTIASFTGNVNSYTQVTLQNKSSGVDATADFIITADNGSDTVNYADLGIINSGYDNTTPSNSLGNIVYAADTYLYAQGNASNVNQPGGNIAIGTTVSGKTIKLFAGGTTNAAVIATVASTGVSVNGNLTVSGGNITGNTNGFAIGYRDIPQVSLAANATIAVSDAGKHYYSTSATPYTLTVANNTVAAFAIGATINIINQGTANITIAQGSGVTMYMAGNSTASNRTLASFGVATITKVSTNTWFVSGVGLT